MRNSLQPAQPAPPKVRKEVALRLRSTSFHDQETYDGEKRPHEIREAV
jgi:hypothetical protein